MNKKDNIKNFGEVFTPDKLFSYLFDDIDLNDKNATYFEPSFGDGRLVLHLKNLLLQSFDEKHIMNNMLYGVEIQSELFNKSMCNLNPNRFKHNFYNMSAVDKFDIFSPLYDLKGEMKKLYGNPPYNKNILKKNDVDPYLWNPSGYTTKLAYLPFVALGDLLLTPDIGKIKYVMPVSFTSNQNTQFFREFLKQRFQINSLRVLPPDAFDDIMIRTCIFDATKNDSAIHDDFTLIRNWNNVEYNTSSNFDDNNSIPLYIGDIGKSAFNKLANYDHSLTTFKGWNGADSYAKQSSKNESEYEYKYLNSVNKGNPIFYSTAFPDKSKAKVNNKKNNAGDYNRFGYKKIIINEVVFDSLETTKHIKYIFVDDMGKFGLSPKNTCVIETEHTKLDDIVSVLLSKEGQFILSTMKDYNHNDDFSLKVLPINIDSHRDRLTEEEREFIESNFEDLDITVLYGSDYTY
jgi:hypothetical protein